MTEPEQDPKPKEIPRNPDGTFPAGYTPPTAWGTPGHPPPIHRNGGRPKKSAWVHALERQLAEDPNAAEEMAREIRRIALGGDSDKVRLAAMQEIEDRAGLGPVSQQINLEADIRTETRAILIVGGTEDVPALPPEVLELEQQRAAVEDAAQIRRRTAQESP